jgi:hypothetical protein
MLSVDERCLQPDLVGADRTVPVASVAASRDLDLRHQLNVLRRKSPQRIAEQALADTSKPIPLPASITPMTWPASERDEIRQRVSNFKAHQEKMTRKREDYYFQIKTKMLAPVDPAFVQLRKNPPA